MDRKWIPTFAELIDRLSIQQLKEVFMSENKEKYEREMKDIIYDLNSIIKENKIEISGELIAAIIVLSQMNAHIWYNESKARKGEDQNLHLLRLTHSLNGLRNSIQNYILSQVGQTERMDYKIDCLASEFKSWEISLLKNKKE